MFNLGPLEVIAILVVALVVFGPSKLPEIGKQVGKAIREVKKFQNSIQSEVNEVFDVNKPANQGTWAATSTSNGAVVDPTTNTIKVHQPAGSTEPKSDSSGEDAPTVMPGQESLFGEGAQAPPPAAEAAEAAGAEADLPSAADENK